MGDFLLGVVVGSGALVALCTVALVQGWRDRRREYRQRLELRERLRQAKQNARRAANGGSGSGSNQNGTTHQQQAHTWSPEDILRREA